MEGTWGFVIFLWCGLVFGLVILFVYELSKTPERKKHDSEMANERYEKERLSRKIVTVIPLGVTGKQFKRGGLGGALFGGLIGGVPGAVIGGVLRSGESVAVESFAVKYGNGEVKIRECVQGSREYKALMQYVE